MPLVICPRRFLQRNQVFLDALPLLNAHRPGNELHVIPEVTLPGGNVDYFLVSARRREIRDYLALEIQAVDTTGTVWPSRQRLVRELAKLPAPVPPGDNDKAYGGNWRMTAKTSLVQLHHKVETLELLGKRLVFVIQDGLFDYMKREFSMDALNPPKGPEPLHIHVYTLNLDEDGRFFIELRDRQATTTVGVEQMLGMRRSAEIPEAALTAMLLAKMNDDTRLKL